MMNVIIYRAKDKKVFTMFCADVCTINVLPEESSIVLFFNDDSFVRGEFDFEHFNIIREKLEKAIVDNKGWIDLRTNGGFFNSKSDGNYFASDNSGFPEGF